MRDGRQLLASTSAFIIYLVRCLGQTTKCGRRSPVPGSWSCTCVQLEPFLGEVYFCPCHCCFLLPLSVLVFFHPPFPTHVSNACGRMSQQGATRPTTEGKYLDPVASARHKQACWTHKVARMMLGLSLMLNGAMWNNLCEGSVVIDTAFSAE